MNEELQDKLKKDREEKHLESLINIENEHERDASNKRFQEEETKLKFELESKKENVLREWKMLFNEYWIPKNFSEMGQASNNVDEKQYELYYRVSRQVIMNLYKKHCFDAWNFKNNFLSSNEYILLEGFKKYLVNLNKSKTTDSAKQEEEVLSKIMEILDRLKENAEMLTISQDERKNVSDYIEKNKCTIGDAIKGINEARELNKEKLIKRKSVSNLSDVFLPAMITIRTLVFLTIGSKRVKKFKEDMEKEKAIIKKKDSENSELEGQIKLLEEVKLRVKKDNLVESNKNPTVISDAESDYKKSLASISDVIFFLFIF
jgi:hypothetical protein